MKKDIFKTIGKGALALVLAGGLATGGYYLGKEIFNNISIAQQKPDKDDHETPPEKPNMPALSASDLSSLGLTAEDTIITSSIQSGDKLVSSSKKDFGIWFFNSKDNTFTQIYNKGQNWNVISPSSKTVYFGSLDEGLPYLRVTLDYQISEVYPENILDEKNTFWNVYDGLEFFSPTSGGLFIYNPNTQKIKKIIDDGTGWTFSGGESGHLFIASASTEGLYEFDKDTYTCKQIYTEGNWSYMGDYKDKTFMSPEGKTNGILCYDKNNKTCKKIYDEGIGWTLMTDTKGVNVYPFFSSVDWTEPAPGLLYYEEDTDQATKIYDNDDDFDLLLETDSGYYFRGKNYSCVYFDKTSKQATEIQNDQVSSNERINEIYDVFSGALFITRNYKVYMFQEDTKTQTQLFSEEIGELTRIQVTPVGKGVVISAYDNSYGSSAENNKSFFVSSEKDLKVQLSLYVGGRLIIDSPNGCFMGNDSYNAQNVIYIDYSNGEASQVHQTDSRYSISTDENAFIYTDSELYYINTKNNTVKKIFNSESSLSRISIKHWLNNYFFYIDSTLYCFNTETENLDANIKLNFEDPYPYSHGVKEIKVLHNKAFIILFQCKNLIVFDVQEKTFKVIETSLLTNSDSFTSLSFVEREDDVIEIKDGVTGGLYYVDPTTYEITLHSFA